MHFRAETRCLHVIGTTSAQLRCCSSNIFQCCWLNTPNFGPAETSHGARRSGFGRWTSCKGLHFWAIVHYVKPPSPPSCFLIFQDFSVPGVLESPLGEAGKKRIKKVPRILKNLSHERDGNPNISHQWFRKVASLGYTLVIKHSNGKNPINGGFHSKITYFYGPFSSKPCLITPEGNPAWCVLSFQQYFTPRSKVEFLDPLSDRTFNELPYFSGPSEFFLLW